MITHVAIIYKCKIYSLLKPNRHSNVIQGIPGGIKDWDIQGFIDDKGNFLTRKQAYIVATTEGQIKHRLKGQYDGNELYSEDLW